MFYCTFCHIGITLNLMFRRVSFIFVAQKFGRNEEKEYICSELLD